MAMIVPVLVAASLLAEAAPLPPLIRVENARVIAAGPRPPESGIFAAYADIDVALPGGSQQRMYMLWMSRNQYLPDVGAVCTIVYRREPLLPGNLHRPVGQGPGDQGPLNVVHELTCGFEAGAPPLFQRSPSAR